ncbi:MAG: ATP-binding cassette domain-containing protein [Acidimicrobiales bacterium]
MTFTIAAGAALGLVGASGSGKSTLAKLITGWERPTSGTISSGDIEVHRLRHSALRAQPGPAWRGTTRPNS